MARKGKRVRPSGRRPGRPRGASGERTRERIVRAALACFAEKGFGATSVRDIARRSRIRVASLYHYFPSKERMYVEAHERLERRLRDIVLSTLGQGLEMREVVRRTVGRLFDLFCEHRDLARLAFRGCLDGSVSPMRAEVGSARHWLGMAEGVLKPAAQRGLLKDVDPALFIVTMDALVHWHIVNSRVYRQLLGKDISDPAVAERAKAHIIQVALRTLGLE